jgi:hypothetical protein
MAGEEEAEGWWAAWWLKKVTMESDGWKAADRISACQQVRGILGHRIVRWERSSRGDKCRGLGMP